MLRSMEHPQITESGKGVAVGHYPNCERAQSRRCRCTMCWGTMHGWVEAINLAKDPEPSGRYELRSVVDDAWRSAFVGRRGKNKHSSGKVSYPKKIAGIDSGIADLIDFLAQELAESKRDGGRSVTGVSTRAIGVQPGGADSPRNWDLPTVDNSGPSQTRNRRDSGVERLGVAPVSSSSSPSSGGPSGDDRPGPEEPIVLQVEKLGNLLATEVLKEIDRECSGSVPASVKVALADHFWCDLFAQLSHVMDDGMKLVDSVPDRVVRLILESREEDARLPLEERVVKVAVKRVWKYLQDLTMFGWIGPARKFIPVVQILAVLICKAPERHRAVVEYCLDPLKGYVKPEAKKRLVKVLGEWLPQTRIEIGSSEVAASG